MEAIACLILVLPVVGLYLLISVLRRVGRLEGELTTLRATMDALTERWSMSPPTESPARAAPPTQPQAPVAAFQPSPAQHTVAPPLPIVEPTTAAHEPVAPSLRIPPLPTGSALASGPPVAARQPASTEGAPGMTLEAFVSTRLILWIAAISLFLAAVYFVKWAIDRNLITRELQFGMSLAFSGVLLLSGERLRRSFKQAAEALSAAGVASAFAAILAAIHLWGLLGQTTGFVCLAAAVALGAALSLRQGPFVAVLALVGGYLAPGLIRSEAPSAIGLFSYLLLLQVGLGYVAWRSARTWLPGLTLIGALAWSVLWLLQPGQSGADGPVQGAFLLMTLAIYLIAALRATPPGGAEEGAARQWEQQRAIACVAAVSATGVVQALLVSTAQHALLDWAFLWLLGAAGLVLARFRRSLAPVAPALAVITLLTLWSWQNSANPDGRVFGCVVASLGLLFSVGSYLHLLGRADQTLWAVLCSAAALAHFGVAYAGFDSAGPDGVWGAAALVLAALLITGTLPLRARRAQGENIDAPLAALLTGATTFISLAAPLELDRQWIGGAWAIETALLMQLYARLRLDVLRRLAEVLCGVTLVWLVVQAFLLEPAAQPGWILYRYGVPVAALALAAWTAARSGAHRTAQRLELGALALAFFGVTLFVRLLHHPRDFAHPLISFPELASYLNVHLALAIGCLLLGRWRSRDVLWSGGLVAAGLSAGLLGALLLTARNPWVSDESVGAGFIWNHLLLAYGLPAMLLFVLAGVVRGRQPPYAARVAGVAGLVLTLSLVTLQVRQAFQGPNLHAGAIGDPELYSYSVAWGLLGMLLLTLGLLTRGVVLRSASLAVIMLTVGKVFIIDAANLTGLYRVFSLLGLGLSLIAVAMLYQRWVFRPTAAQSLGPGGPPLTEALR